MDRRQTLTHDKRWAKNQPIRNKSRLWRPCLLTDREEMSNLYRGSSILNVYKNQQNRQTGSRIRMGPKTLPTIWGTYMKLVTKYQISAINSCWEKCDEKCAYMFNVYKNQLSRQAGSKNLTGPKTLSTLWHTYMKLVTKYQISAIDSCWEKCDENLTWTDGQR